MKVLKTLVEDFRVKETKINDPYDSNLKAVNLDFYIDNTLFGEASISGVNTDDAFLYDVGVLPWFRGNGYANQMLDHILNHYQVTNLTVRPDNIPAINLYKKHGFKIDRSFDDNGQEMYVMLKESLDSQKYYRLEIDNLGGIFRNSDQIINAGRMSKDEDIYDLANRLDGLVGQLEMQLSSPPEGLSKNNKYAFTEAEFNFLKTMPSFYDERISVIEDLANTLDELGYELKIIKVLPNKINYQDDEQIAYENLGLTEDKDFVPSNVKKDTCVAVAYSMLTGMDYDDALKKFPNGRFATLQKELELIRPEEDENTLNSFLLKHKQGRYLVSIIDNKHHDGHAVAIIDGVAYNVQDFNKNSEIKFYADLSNQSKVKSKETSYLDELDKHKNIKDNKYINYAYQKLIAKFQADLNEKGKLRTTVRTNSTDGFELRINNKKFEFKFPFNCSEKEIYQAIDDIIEKSIV